jgi:uncharacterized protein (DUF983 family)
MAVVAAEPSALVMLARGLAGRCPRCGQAQLFRRWFTIVPRCPRCGLDLERGEGFWLGTLAINLGVTELVFGGTLVGVMVLTWPNVPWVALTVAAVLLNGLLPLILYPFARTTFLAIDLLMYRMDRIDRPDERPTDQPGSAA